MPTVTSSTAPTPIVVSTFVSTQQTDSTSVLTTKPQEKVSQVTQNSDQFTNGSSSSHKQVLGLVETKRDDLEALSKAGCPVLDSSGVEIISEGPQYLSNQTIAQLQKDKKLLGYVQLTPSSRSTTDRYISLVDKKGQIVGFGLPVNNYSFSVSARRPTDKGLVDAPELVKLLAKGELSVGPEYFKVYNSTQFKSNLIGLMQVPEKLETSRGAYLSMASRSQITFGSSFF